MQQFVCPFFVQMDDEKRPLSLRTMRSFLNDFVIVDCNSEDAGSAPKAAGEDATVCLDACIAKLVAMPPEVKLPLTPATLRQVADKDGGLKVRLSIEFGELACISHDGSYEGLNDYCDEEVFKGLPGLAVEYEFRPLYVDGEKIVFEFKCDCSEVLKELADDEAGPVDED